MCNCLQQAQEELVQYNTKISVPIMISKTSLVAGPPIIATEKIDKKVRQGPIKLMAAYCPFCGEKYKDKT